ncbi:endoplasmic reticulum membrane sensor NFE2L1-like isoform X1 [Octopus vulgaris]|uniref:Endoplasmic reticulum membrane sensor NFE2L1-like isoform X1 n=1 Tax=Octopus vulgaris TaxID=6645 RepID=A0AA36BJ52_OCTVU|nr:endoplasmic reticulum membrane sensor NFE2L1-like isoform X1 [Octopus vulgaris]
MIKQCFTDSLISLAIVLSLLRTDVTNYFSSDYISYPEVQEIILGGSTAYGRVNNYIDNNRNQLYLLGQHLHFKNVDYGNIFSTSFYNELRRLTSNPFSYNYDDYFPQRRGRRRRQRVRYPGFHTDYSTYLVSAEQSSNSVHLTENSNENNNGDNDDNSNIVVDNNNDHDNNIIHEQHNNDHHPREVEENNDSEAVRVSDETEDGSGCEQSGHPSEEVDYLNRINSYFHSDGKRDQSAAITTTATATDLVAGVSHPTCDNINISNGNDSETNPDNNNNNNTVANISNLETYVNDSDSTTTPTATDDSSGQVNNSHAISSSDPTNEDLDLIDVLYLQDIDLGVQREVYDITLRRELEREQEIALQKEREKQKQYEHIQLKLQEEQRRLEQQYRADNYTQDIETGEWIPLYQPAPPLNIPLIPNTTNILEQQQQQQQPCIPQPMPIPQLQTDLTNLQTNSCQYQTSNLLNSTLEEALQTLDIDANKNNTSEQTVFELEQYLANCPVANFSNATTEQYEPILPSQFNCNLLPCPTTSTALNQCTEYNTPIHNTFQEHSQSTLPSCERQNSLDNWWREISGSLEMTTAGTSADNPTHCPELIQNATLPIPSGDIGCGNNLNTSLNASVSTANCSTTINNHSSCNPPEWDNQNYLFPNMTTSINESESMMEMEKILPAIQQNMMTNIDLPNITEDLVSFDDASRDSAVCSLASSASPLQEFNEFSAYDQLEGATGGSDYDSCSSGCKSVKLEPNTYYCSYDSMRHGQQSTKLNQSTSSNDTDFNYQPSNTNHILHNHTYPQQPQTQNISYEPSVSSISRSKTYSSSATTHAYHRGPTSRDHKRLQELKVPLSMSQIINSSVEEFNDLVRKYPLPEPQLRLIRDIRRRGKNKVAAQNCRKRKLDIIGTLEEEVIQMRHERDRLLREGNLIHKQTREMKEKYNVRYHEVFRSLRDEYGNSYDPQEYSLQQSSDGNVFLVRKSLTSDEKTMDSNRKKKTDEK